MTLRREASVAMNKMEVRKFIYSLCKNVANKCKLMALCACKPFNSQNLKDGYKQNIKKMQTLGVKPQTLHVSESGVGLLRESSEYEMGNLRRDDSFNM